MNEQAPTNAELKIQLDTLNKEFAAFKAKVAADNEEKDRQSERKYSDLQEQIRMSGI
jgi:hypothetical protein